MLVVTAALGVVSIIAVYWAAKVSMAFGRDLRAAIFGQVQAFSQVEVNHFGAASLITRNTNDVQQVQMVVLIGLTVMVVGADHGGRRRDHGPAPGRAAHRRSCW